MADPENSSAGVGLAERLAVGVLERIGEDPIELLGDDPDISRHLGSLPASEADRIRTESLVYVMFTAVAVSLASGVGHDVLTEFHTQLYRRLAGRGNLSTPEEMANLNKMANDRYGAYYETLSRPMSPEPIDELGMSAAILLLGSDHADLLFRVRGGLSRLFLNFGETVRGIIVASSPPS